MLHALPQSMDIAHQSLDETQFTMKAFVLLYAESVLVPATWDNIYCFVACGFSSPW